MEEVDGSADPTVQLRARTERLRAAIKAAGGQTLVSNKSGIPLATIRRILANNDTTLGSIIPICAACGVSLDWLATGVQELPSAPSSSPQLASFVDRRRLGIAVAMGATAMIDANVASDPDIVGVLASILYDALGDDEGVDLALAIGQVAKILIEARATVANRNQTSSEARKNNDDNT